MNTEVGRNLLWNETKVCSLLKKKEKVRQPPGLGLSSVAISIQWPIKRGVQAALRLRAAAQSCFALCQKSTRLFNVQLLLAGQTWNVVPRVLAAIVSEQHDAETKRARPSCRGLLFNHNILNGDEGLVDKRLVMWVCALWAASIHLEGRGALISDLHAFSAPCKWVIYFFARNWLSKSLQ